MQNTHTLLFVILMFMSALFDAYADTSSTLATIPLSPDSLFALTKPAEKAKADSIFANAKSAFRNRDYPVCVDLLFEYREIKGITYALEYYLGMSFYYLEQWHWAVKHLEMARTLEKTHEDAILYILHLIYKTIGFEGKSLEKLKELKKKYPKSSYVRAIKKAAKETRKSPFKITASARSIYHSDYYSLATTDINKNPKEKGFMHELSSDIGHQWKANTRTGISFLHDNAMQDGIESYTYMKLYHRLPIANFDFLMGADLSFSNLKSDGSNLSLTLQRNIGKAHYASLGWSWLSWPDPDPAQNHYGLLSGAARVLNLGPFSFTVNPSLAIRKAEAEIIETRVALARVSGVIEGTNQQTGFYADQNYTIPVPSVTVSFLRYPPYQDFPYIMFQPALPNLWLSRNEQTIESYAHGLLGATLSYTIGRRFIASFSPQFSMLKYLKPYRWSEVPTVLDLNGEDKSPVLVNSFWMDQNYGLSRYFIVYKNQEDGLLYYRERLNNSGIYRRLDWHFVSKYREDLSASIPIGLTAILTRKFILGFSYTFSTQTTNMPQSSPVIAGYNDHSAAFSLIYLVN